MAMLGYLTVPLGGGRVAPVNLLSEDDFVVRVDSHFEKDATTPKKINLTFAI